MSLDFQSEQLRDLPYQASDIVVQLCGIIASVRAMLSGADRYIALVTGWVLSWSPCLGPVNSIMRLHG